MKTKTTIRVTLLATAAVLSLAPVSAHARAPRISDRMIAPRQLGNDDNCTNGQVLAWNTATSFWECTGNGAAAGSINPTAGDATSAIADGTGCTAGEVLRRNAADNAYECVQLNPVTDTTSFGLGGCAATQVLRINAGATAWECAAFGVPGADSVTSGSVVDDSLTLADLADTLTLDAALVLTGDTAGDTMTLNLIDNTANSLLIQNNTGGADYLSVATTDGAEAVVVGNIAAGSTLALNSADWTISTTGNVAGIGSFAADGTVTFTGQMDLGDGGDTMTLRGSTITIGAAADNISIAGEISGASPLVFEGATDDVNELTIAVADVAADRTVTFADAAGTIMLSTLATNAPDAANSVSGASNALVFEGATADGFETSIVPTDPTADRTVTLPNDTGAVVVSPSGVADAANAMWGIAGGFRFEGATPDGFELDLTSGDPLADVTLTLPAAATGAVMVSTLVTNAPDAANAVSAASNALVFEGATADGFELLFSPQDPVADVTVTVPATTGAVILSPGGLADAANAISGGTGTFIFEGATADAFEVTLAVQDPLADATVTLPAAPGTVIVSPGGAADAANAVFGTNNGFIFEGATADLVELTVLAVDPTGADATLMLPNLAGTSAATMVSTLTTNAPDAANSVWSASNEIMLEGATVDAFELHLTATEPTADRTVTFADAAGTVVLSTLATNAPDAANSVSGASNALVFEGATADGFETSIVSTDPTADRTVTLPNASLTVAGIDLVQTFSVAQTFDGAVTFNGGITANDASADTFLIGQSGATDDTVTIAGDISLTDDQWSVSAGGSADFLELNDTPIGNVTPNTGAFSTVTATGNVTMNDASADTIAIGAAADTVTITSNSLSLTDDQWSVTAGGNATFVDMTMNGNIILGDTATDTLIVNATILGGSPLVFEGATADANELTLAVVDPAGDVTVTIPATTTTLAGLAITQTFTGGNTFNGALTLGDGGDNISVDSDDWDISGAGAFSGVASIAAAGNQTALNIDIPVTGVDAGLHTLALQVDGNNGLSIAATGDGAGGVGARTVQIGVSAAADSVTIGDANADVALTDANWSILGSGAPNFADGTLPLADLVPGGAANLLVTNAGATAWAAVALSGDATIVASGALTIAANAVALGADTTGDYVATVAAATAPSGVAVAGAAGEATAIALDFDYSATLAGNPALAAGEAVFASTGIIFEGSVADANELLLAVSNPAADVTVTIPAITSTLITNADTGSVTSGMVLNNDLSMASDMAAFTSADLAGRLSDETGTGVAVFSAAPTLTGTTTMGSMSLGGATVQDILTATAVLDFAGTTDTCESLTIAVTNAAVGDACFLGPPSALPSANSWVSCFVSAAGTATVRHCSHGASGDPAGATYRAVVVQF